MSDDTFWADNRITLKHSRCSVMYYRMTHTIDCLYNIIVLHYMSIKNAFCRYNSFFFDKKYDNYIIYRIYYIGLSKFIQILFCKVIKSIIIIGIGT